MALGKLKAPRSLESLSNAIVDEDARVAQAARKALAKVAKAAVKSKPFKTQRYEFTVAGLRGGGSGHNVTAEMKDYFMEGLLAYENVDVGRSAVSFGKDGKGSKKRPLALDLTGQILAISPKRCTLELAVALQPGGFVVTRFKRISANGKSQSDALRNAVKLGLGRVLGFLGAR